MSSSSERSFWQWFVSKQDKLRSLTSAQDPLLQELSEALQAIDPDLSFELNHLGNGDSQLIVSANGIRELIGTVESLVAARPDLEGWNICALRPRRPLQGATLHCGDVVLNAETVGFSLSAEMRRIDVTLYIENASDDEYYRWLETVFLLLDAAIGERDVAEHIGEVFIKERSTEMEDGAVQAFTELPNAFDALLTETQEELARLDALSPHERRRASLQAVQRKAEALAEQLEEESKEIEWESAQDPMLTIELHFRQCEQRSSEQLINLLEQSRNAVAEEVEFGSVSGPVRWVHTWFDIPKQELSNIAATLESLANLGYQSAHELEAVFLTWAEEPADISNILGSLDTLAEAQLVLEAHTELDKGNPARAVEVLEEVLEEDMDNLEVRSLLAYAYAKLRDKEMAQACLSELAEDVSGSGSHPSLYWNIACTYALLAEAQQACDNLRQALELDPELRELAIKDPDLSSLRGEPEFDELLYQA